MIKRITFFAGVICFLFLILSCKGFHRNKLHAEIPIENIETGAVLAQKYCQSCHLFPEPSLLDVKSWEEGVLPNMGPRLGIFQHLWDKYPSARYDKNLDSGFYPSKPVLTFDEWQYILDYYTATSPDTMPGQNRKSIINRKLPLFQVLVPSFNTPVPSTCFLKIDSSQKKRLWVADLKTRSLYRLNPNLQPIDSVTGIGTVVDLQLTADGGLVTDIGEINPNNGRSGSLSSLLAEDSGKLVLAATPILQNMARPVQTVQVDLDRDGMKDFVSCEFGFLQGSLSWYRQQANSSFERKVLSSYPGALKVYVQDHNNDGLPDLWVLFSQGDERIVLYTNKGNGTFEEKSVLRFPSVYGSTFFELVDFNSDGYLDILYTCGDNADYSTVLKPYHGVYIFLNNGKNHFRQEYFFPINGCYKALARDFDGDNDLDIATISFFADYAKQPEEGFVYLENKGNLNFVPFSFPQAASGRWLTMDAGDLDGDGRLDIVLGNFADGPPVTNKQLNWKDGPLFILLKNIGRK